jgi:hypothetical protein
VLAAAAVIELAVVAVTAAVAVARAIASSTLSPMLFGARPPVD